MAIDLGLVLGATSVVAVPVGFGIGIIAMANPSKGELIFARVCFVAAALGALASYVWLTHEMPLNSTKVIASGAVGALICIAVVWAASWVDSKENPREAATSAQPAIQIRFESRAPYEASEVEAGGRILSTVRIGLKATGAPLSNCNVYIEKIAPEPPIMGGLPILLSGGGFIMRPDDPEKLLDIASHWNHVPKFRFNSPGGWWAETMNYIDDKEARVIQIRIEATELQKSFLFKLWIDDEKQMHLRPMF